MVLLCDHRARMDFWPGKKGRMWRRLERYAVWKQKRLPLHRLPGDVLEHLCESHLTPTDTCALVQALTHRDVSPFVRDDVVQVPVELRTHWMCCVAVQVLRRILVEQLQPELLYLSTRCAFIRVFADWSPFKRRVPPPALVECAWKDDRREKKWRWEVDEAHLARVVRRCARKGTPGLHLAAYEHFVWSTGRRTIVMRPALTRCVVILPDTIATKTTVRR